MALLRNNRVRIQEAANQEIKKQWKGKVFNFHTLANMKNDTRYIDTRLDSLHGKIFLHRMGKQASDYYGDVLGYLKDYSIFLDEKKGEANFNELKDMSMQALLSNIPCLNILLQDNDIIESHSDEDTDKYLSLSLWHSTVVMPEVAPALAAINLVRKDEMPTMAVDQFLRVYWNADFVRNLLLAAEFTSVEKCETCGRSNHNPLYFTTGVFLHEVWHPLRDHLSRGEIYVSNRVDLEETDPQRMNLEQRKMHKIHNIGADMEINGSLREVFNKNDGTSSSFCLPHGAFFPDTYKFEENLIAEVYADMLLQNKQFMEDQSSGMEISVSMASDMAGDEDSDGTPTVDAPGLHPAEVDLVRKEVAKNIKKQAGRGTMPAGFEVWSAEQLSPAKKDWRKEMPRNLRHQITNFKGTDIRSYRRLNRRCSSVPKLVLPSKKALKPQIAVVLDSSGSMGQDDFELAGSHLMAVLVQLNAEVDFISCDAKGVATKIRDIKDVKLIGGGGTDMRVGIDMAFNDLNRNIVIVMTDGDTPWPDFPVEGTKVIAALTRKPYCAYPPSWIRTVELFDEE